MASLGQNNTGGDDRTRAWAINCTQTWLYTCRADSRFTLSQRETALLCNDVSHWLCANLESAQPWHSSSLRWSNGASCVGILKTTRTSIERLSRIHCHNQRIHETNDLCFIPPFFLQKYVYLWWILNICFSIPLPWHITHVNDHWFTQS